MLNWVASEDDRTLTAVGARGEYMVTRAGRWHWALTAHGHDGLPMRACPGTRTFRTPQAAQDWADEVDRMPAEAQIGGE